MVSLVERGPPRRSCNNEMRYVDLAVLLGAAARLAQPSIQIGPDRVQIGPRHETEPREERIVREEDGCRLTIVRR